MSAPGAARLLAVARERELTQQPTVEPAPGIAPAALLPGVASVSGLLTLPRTAGNAPHLPTALGAPDDTPGRLIRADRDARGR